MNLPDLPKKNNKKEAVFGIFFRNWLKDNPLPYPASFELKHTRDKDYFYLAELQKNTNDLVRITMGSKNAPDYIYTKNLPAFIVIKYPHNFYIIPAEKLYNLKTKSLKESEAKLLDIK